MGEMLGGGNIFSWARYEQVRNLVSDVPLGVICLHDGIREKGEVGAIFGIEFSTVEYGKLRDSVKYIRNKYKPVWEVRGSGKSIIDWLAPIKKGSNKIRSLISGRGSRLYRTFSFQKIRPICTLWNQMGIEIEESLISNGMLLWEIREIDTDIRQFVFRWNQGMVHGNTVISHFGDVDRKCTFCKMVKREQRERELGRELTMAETEALDVPDEDRPHIYWECSTVQDCVKSVHERFWGGGGEVEKKPS